MVTMTQAAINKVLDILGSQDSPVLGLRVSVVGGGCSGFSYSLEFTDKINHLDKTYKFESIVPNFQSSEKKTFIVVVDQASLLYLDGVEIDYVETLDGSGFKFNNPNVKSTCGCGSSFQV